MEPDAHVAVEAPEPLDAQQVVAVPAGVALLPGVPGQGPGVQRLPAALRRAVPPPGEHERGAPREAGDQSQDQYGQQGGLGAHPELLACWRRDV